MHLSSVLIFFLVTSACKTASAQYVYDNAYVMAHDAAMVFLMDESGCGTHKTQALLLNKSTEAFVKGNANTLGNSPLTALLDCGARALDMRLTSCPSCQPQDKVCMNHGNSYICSTTFDEQLPAIIEWVDMNPGEWVFLKIDTEGDSAAEQRVKQLLSDHHVFLLTGDSPTYCHGAPPPYVRLVAYLKDACSDDNYDEWIGYCSGYFPDRFGPGTSYSNMQGYIDQSEPKYHENMNKPWTEQKFFETQLIWQQKGSQQLNGCWDYYDVLHISHTSDLNTEIWKMFDPNQAGGRLENKSSGMPFNMIKLNDMCFHGYDIAKAIGTSITDSQRNRCIEHCGSLNAQHECAGNRAKNPNNYKLRKEV